MQCIICKASMSYYFSKNIDYCALGRVDYWRCTTCGFVASATHFEMQQHEWELLNTTFHADPIFNLKDNPRNRPPPHAEQARMVHSLFRHGLLHGEPWLDWGAGPGVLSQTLADKYGLTLMNFDQYIKPPINALEAVDIRPGAFNLVVSSALFEHVRSRDTLDQIEACVARDDGVLAVHTLVRGEIPCDSNWMYLLPVHCAFHTNRSMQILMGQWGYRCSVYNENAKLWAMFHGEEDSVRARVASLNAAMTHKYLHLKEGFMDYWP